MIKNKYFITCLLCCVCVIKNYAQILVVYKNSEINTTLKLKNENYKNKELAIKGIEETVVKWQSLGYMAVSIDSTIYKQDTIINYIYVGKKLSWKSVSMNDSIATLVNSMVNIAGNKYKNNSNAYLNLPDTLLQYYKNNGYPFVKVFYNNFKIEEDSISASLEVNKGIFYKIDSVRLFGNLNIKRKVLKKLLGIEDGIMYSDKNLMEINTKLNKLQYVDVYKPWDLTLLTNAGIVNIYANKKNKNKLDAIVGFLPNNQQTSGGILFTVDAKLHLENAFASGEIIDMNWQQIQPTSPRINLNYIKPFFLNSNIGIMVDFNLYKRDTSFLNVQSKIGINYPINNNSSIDVYLNNASTRVIEPDTFFIIANKRLPNVQDVSFNKLGINYTYNNTNNNISPRKGISIKIETTGGLKNIEKNNNFTNIKLGNFNYKSLYDSIQLNDYQLKILANFNIYKSINKNSVLKIGAKMGWISTNNLLRNELFQIGGFNVLRGFDEENIFTSTFFIASTEYRYLFTENSFFFGFTDIGVAKNINNINNNYLGIGGGLALQTKQGMLQVSLALGKTNNLPINFRETKIHVGIINNF